MGQSAEAILAFGFDLEDDPKEIGDLDFDKMAYEAVDLKRPTSGDHMGPEWDAWRREAAKARKAFPVELINHGYDFEFKFLAVNGTKKTCDWGNVEEVDPEKLVVDGRLVEEMREFCAKYSIEWHEPKWYLLAFYG